MKRAGLWTHPDFVRLWTASTVSLFGSLISRTALPFAAILVLGATPLDIGWLVIAELLPGFLVGLIAGVWVDRLRRRPIMIAADLGRAALLLTVPLAALAGALSLAQLYLVAIGTSVLTVWFDVAYQTYLPTLVGRDELIEGNSKLTAAGAVAEAAAFSAGGWLVQLLSAPVAVLVDAATFVWSAAFIARIRAPEPPRDAGGAHPLSLRGVLTEVADGLRALRANRVLAALAVGNAGLGLGFYVTGSVILLFTNRELGFAPGVLGVIFAVGGVSSLAGAIVAQRLAAFGVGPVLIVALSLAAVGQALPPLANGANAVAVVLLVGQQVITDSAATVYDVTEVSLRQAIAPPALLGRVNATVRVLETGAKAAGAIVGGWLGERAGLRAPLLVSAAVFLVTALLLSRSPARRVHAMPTPVVDEPIGSGRQDVVADP